MRMRVALGSQRTAFVGCKHCESTVSLLHAFREVDVKATHNVFTEVEYIEWTSFSLR